MALTFYFMFSDSSLCLDMFSVDILQMILHNLSDIEIFTMGAVQGLVNYETLLN